MACVICEKFQEQSTSWDFPVAPTVEAIALQYSNEPTTSDTKSLNVITPTFEVERSVD